MAERTIYLKIIITFFTIAMTMSATAQVDEVNEIESEQWYSVRLKKKLNKEWNVLLRTEARSLQGNDQYLIEPAVRYDLSKRLSLTATYRLSLEDKNSGLDYRSRLDVDLKYTQKFKPLELSARLMYSDVLDDQGLGAGRNRLRSRLEAEYPLLDNKLKPSFGAELFYSFDITALERLRYIGSIAYELTDPMDVFISYRQEDFFEKPLVAHILLVGLKYKL